MNKKRKVGNRNYHKDTIYKGIKILIFPDQNMMTWKYWFSTNQKYKIKVKHNDDAQMNPTMPIVSANLFSPTAPLKRPRPRMESIPRQIGFGEPCIDPRPPKK